MQTDQQTIDALCTSYEPFSSLYINKIRATLRLDNENFDARISIYYIPDSVIYLSAANTGFEIVRAAITPDSLIFINRIDRIVYTRKEAELGYKAPVAFEDLEQLLNKRLICNKLESLVKDGEYVLLDISAPNISKKLFFDPKLLKMNKFEFFHKKTGEYIVGETNKGDSVFVYSNYLFDDVEIVATGGALTYNEDIHIDLSFNKNKYLLISD